MSGIRIYKNKAGVIPELKLHIPLLESPDMINFTRGDVLEYDYPGSYPFMLVDGEFVVGGVTLSHKMMARDIAKSRVKFDDSEIRPEYKEQYKKEYNAEVGTLTNKIYHDSKINGRVWIAGNPNCPIISFWKPTEPDDVAEAIAAVATELNQSKNIKEWQLDDGVDDEFITVLIRADRPMSNTKAKEEYLKKAREEHTKSPLNKEKEKPEGFGSEKRGASLQQRQRMFAEGKEFNFDAWEDYDELYRAALERMVDEVAKKDVKKQPWRVLPKERIKVIWDMFSKYGFVRDEDGMDEIADLIVNNIAKLDVNTMMLGHTSDNPKNIMTIEYDYVFKEPEPEPDQPQPERKPRDKKQLFLFPDVQADVVKAQAQAQARAQRVASGDLTEEEWMQLPITYEEFEDRLDSYLFDDNWNQYRVSDYAMDPLRDIATNIMAAKTPEEKLVLCDKALNVIHMRGDIAALFVKGGSKALSDVSLENMGDIQPEEPRAVKVKQKNVRKPMPIQVRQKMFAEGVIPKLDSIIPLFEDFNKK